MAKKRTDIPKPIREQVLKEYNYLCAVCGQVNPQLHHIDEDPSNHDPMNLIPLCPNNHLIDVHNPTQPIEPGKLRLLRKYKDPTILAPQFHPLFIRVKFLDEIENHKLYDLEGQAKELIEIAEVLEMGTFYSKRIKELIGTFGRIRYLSPNMVHENKRLDEFEDREYRNKLHDARDQVFELVVELLRYQPWRLEIQNGTAKRQN